MNTPMIINGYAYWLDSTYNAIRLAANLAKRDDVEMTVFLLGDGVTAAMAGQKTPDGYYKLDRMLESVMRHGGRSCAGTSRMSPKSAIDELGDPRVTADKSPGLLTRVNDVQVELEGLVMDGERRTWCRRDGRPYRQGDLISRRPRHG